MRGTRLGNRLVNCSGNVNEMFESSNELRLVLIRVKKRLQKKLSFCSNEESLVEFRSNVKFKINDELKYTTITNTCTTYTFTTTTTTTNPTHTTLPLHLQLVLL